MPTAIVLTGAPKAEVVVDFILRFVRAFRQGEKLHPEVHVSGRITPVVVTGGFPLQYFDGVDLGGRRVRQEVIS